MRSTTTTLFSLGLLCLTAANVGVAQQLGPYVPLPPESPRVAQQPSGTPKSEDALPPPASPAAVPLSPVPPDAPSITPSQRNSSPFPAGETLTPPPVAPRVEQSPLQLPAAAPEIPPPDSVLPAIENELWWESLLMQPLRKDAVPLGLDVERLWKQTLQHSEQILAIRESPLIEAENIVQAQAEFDPVSFMQTKFKDVNDPVGNRLTTGGPPRFRDRDWDFAAGARKKTTSGGQVDITQNIGFENSNSVFFTPQNQGTGRLVATYRQPLLRGAGWCYNQSFIVLAEVNTRTAEDQFTRQLHEQLVLVTKGYWQLYYQRAWLLQQRRHLGRVEEVLASLEARREIDTIESQVIRARAALASRRANLARAEAAVRDAEARLRAMVNAPEMLTHRSAEMIPLQLPHRELVGINESESMKLALKRRPELDAAIKKMDAARVKLAMSENELLPSLSVLVDTYVAGLEGNSRIDQALANQFRTGGPGYSAGLFYEMPWGNRAAQAKNRQQTRELTQAAHQFRSALENLATEVEVAVREIATSHQEYLSKRESVAATNAEVIYLQNRWSNLAGDDRSASLLLEDILQAQDRLVDEERTLAQALVNYNIAMTEWRRVTGNMINLFAFRENDIPAEIMHDMKCAISDRMMNPPTHTASVVPPPQSRQVSKSPGLSKPQTATHSASKPTTQPVPPQTVRSFANLFGPPPPPTTTNTIADSRPAPQPVSQTPAAASPPRPLFPSAPPLPKPSPIVVELPPVAPLLPEPASAVSPPATANYPTTRFPELPLSPATPGSSPPR